jgi:hypothetical protein
MDLSTCQVHLHVFLCVVVAGTIVMQNPESCARMGIHAPLQACTDGWAPELPGKSFNYLQELFGAQHKVRASAAILLISSCPLCKTKKNALVAPAASLSDMSSSWGCHTW